MPAMIQGQTLPTSLAVFLHEIGHDDDLILLRRTTQINSSRLGPTVAVDQSGVSVRPGIDLPKWLRRSTQIVTK